MVDDESPSHPIRVIDDHPLPTTVSSAESSTTCL